MSLNKCDECGTEENLLFYIRSGVSVPIISKIKVVCRLCKFHNYDNTYFGLFDKVTEDVFNIYIVSES
jgi:hypothetical protein